jgi:hypothetical protein
MFIHEDTIKWALESLKDYDSATGIKLNKYIGLIELSKICGEAIKPNETYEITSSKLTDSLNRTFTIVPTQPSTNEAVIYLTFGLNWHEDGIRDFLKSKRPPLLQIAILCLRATTLKATTAEGLLSEFTKLYNIPISASDKLAETSQIKVAQSPISNAKFVEICTSIFGESPNSKSSYTPKKFFVSNAGEIDRGPYTQPLLGASDVFDIVKMTRKKDQNQEQRNLTVSTSPALERNPISSRLICALAAKPFVILAGGTGTGKTRAARQVAIQIAGKENVSTVAVGADWTDNRPLLGFRNLLSPDGASYVVPEALKLILKADKNLRDAAMGTKGKNSAGSPIEESIKPFFLILDEMNLSHVERYFADFLSSMESGEALKLHDYDGGLKADGSDLIIPREVEWPRNLFLIGTVNIDETTYMFSPKVLDRAHVIEFKVRWDEIKTGLSFPPAKALASWSAEQTRNFTNIALDDQKVLKKADQESLEEVLSGAYGCLDGTRYNFAHRTARECLNYVAAAQRLSEAKLVEHLEIKGLIDLAILQKALPKLNGSVGSLTETLNKLSEFMAKNSLKDSSDKLRLMIKQLKNDQFVSFIQ